MKLLLRCTTTILVGVLVILFGFIHDIIQAFADSLASTDKVFLKSLNPDLEVYRNEVLHELAGRAEAALLAATSPSVAPLPPLPPVDESQLTPMEQQALRLIDLGLARKTKKVTPFKRRWPVSFEAQGRAGTTTTVTVQPQCLFRGIKLFATDDSAEPGHSTDIIGAFVGNRPIIGPFGAAIIPVAEFAHYKVNNQLLFPTCDPALLITLQVRFRRDCTFYATIMGDAVI